MPFPLGFVSWILIGLVAAVSADRMLPGPRALGLPLAIAIGLAGACLGGLVATLFGFGGLVGFDLRSFTVATLGSMVCLLLLSLARLPAPPADGS